MSLSMVFGIPTTAIASPAPHGFLGDRERSAKRPVAADREEHVDPQALEAVHHLLGVLRSA